MDKNDHIDISFYFDSAYVAPSGVAVYRDSTGTYNKNVAVPFWVAIETLTFGEILRLLHYLQDDVLKDVLNDFNLPLSKRAPFLNMIDILLCLRNNCAHTTLLNRFRTEKRYRINTLLITSFSLTPKNADSVLKLYDSIKILSFFTDVTALRKPLKILKFKMYTNMGIKKGKTTTIRSKAAPAGKITYTSSNKKVAAVNSKGVVKGIKKGKATITVKCNGITKKFVVTVK